ncbi:hypothetical protein [Haloarcula mannanilytica]|uniref:hypothetical protein n=1 Tax=Haloarcula mannanilytica TaxID=2509225 RepID=UPI0010F47EA8|nr:hypothetical protein [Haloarcula mannanilytica]
MSLSDPPAENNPGQYEVEDMSIVDRNGEEVVALGDSIKPVDGSFLDLQPSDSIIVATFDTDAGDVLMIEVVGSEKVARIAADCLDDLLGSQLARNPA